MRHFDEIRRESAGCHGRHHPHRGFAALPRHGRAAGQRSGLHRFVRRRSTIAFLMCLPLILIIAGLVVYPALLFDLSVDAEQGADPLHRSRQFHLPAVARHVLDGGASRSAIFALSAVFFKALIGLITAHLVNNLPAKGQRKWRGMLLVPWVIPLALSTLGWWWLFDPTYSAFNWIAHQPRLRSDSLAERALLGALLGHPGQCLVRRAVLHDHVSGRAEIGARAAL